MSSNEDIRSMADLLKSGARLTDLPCPACSSPIFQLRSGELWCAKCQKRVVVVKKGEPEPTFEPSGRSVMGSLESTLLAKIEEVNEKMRAEKDAEQLSKLGEALSILLENLEKARRIERRK